MPKDTLAEAWSRILPLAKNHRGRSGAQVVIIIQIMGLHFSLAASLVQGESSAGKALPLRKNQGRQLPAGYKNGRPELQQL